MGFFLASSCLIIYGCPLRGFPLYVHSTTNHNTNIICALDINFINFRRAALELWKQRSGPDATYRNLINVFYKAAGNQEYVEAVYKLFC